MRPRGEYGIDAPGVLVLWAGLAVFGGSVAAVGARHLDRGWGRLLVAYGVGSAVVDLAGATLFWYVSTRGKFRIWDRLLDTDAVAGVSDALDLGCGRGAVAIMTALRCPTAQVTGIDLWRTADQSGNGRAAAEANIEANGVADRVHVSTGDMTALPYPDASFDLVTAGLSLHNIGTSSGRATALAEAIRVLRPGGRLVVADIQHAREYATVLTDLGAEVAGPESAGWRGWWSGPWMATSTLRATARRR